MLNDTDVPVFVFVSFIADATTQTFEYAGTHGDHGIISAVALYAIPEPAAPTAIAGLCGLGLAAWRRRRA